MKPELSCFVSQMVIMFLISATSTLGAVAAIQLAVLHVMDSSHRCRSERLKPRDDHGGIHTWLTHQATKVGGRAGCTGGFAASHADCGVCFYVVAWGRGCLYATIQKGMWRALCCEGCSC
jgi:hypothetical protein